MKTTLVLTAAAGLLVGGIGAAQAGPCTNEIDNLAKLLSSKDAGAGPTAGPGTASNITTQAQTPKQAKAAGASGSQEQRPGQQALATSPEEVRKQTEGTGMATGAIQPMPSEASQTLARARQLDQSGKEAECMDAVRQAKQQAGVK